VQFVQEDFSPELWPTVKVIVGRRVGNPVFNPSYERKTKYG
jgi:hypothetical protein